jgi:hypothetical protein
MRAAFKKSKLLNASGITEESAPMQLRLKLLLDLTRICARMALFATKFIVF